MSVDYTLIFDLYVLCAACLETAEHLADFGPVAVSPTSRTDRFGEFCFDFVTRRSANSA